MSYEPSRLPAARLLSPHSLHTRPNPFSQSGTPQLRVHTPNATTASPCRSKRDGAQRTPRALVDLISQGPTAMDASVLIIRRLVLWSSRSVDFRRRHASARQHFECVTHLLLLERQPIAVVGATSVRSAAPNTTGVTTTRRRACSFLLPRRRSPYDRASILALQRHPRPYCRTRPNGGQVIARASKRR